MDLVRHAGLSGQGVTVYEHGRFIDIGEMQMWSQIAEHLELDGLGNLSVASSGLRQVAKVMAARRLTRYWRETYYLESFVLGRAWADEIRTYRRAMAKRRPRRVSEGSG